MLRIAGFLDFVHNAEFKVTRKGNVSETGSVSVLGEGRETRTLLGPLESANLKC
jgi:hypothetical protein